MPRRSRLSLLLLALLVLGSRGPLRAATCPGTATVSLAIDNQSSDQSVSLELEGELLDAAATCDGAGATTYTRVVECSGRGETRCGQIDGLRPGAWVHRLRVHVSESASPQVQSRRTVVLTGGIGVSNLVAWTIYPRSFLVTEVQFDGMGAGGDVLSQIAAAASFTSGGLDRRAFVGFDPDVFPGAHAPKVVNVWFVPGGGGTGNQCLTSGPLCPDGRASAFCFTGSRVVVDGLDRLGRRGAVVLRTGTCRRSLMRVYGSDNVLRGLELLGSEYVGSTIPLDTIAFTGEGAQGNLLDQTLVVGPTRGDGISVEAEAGQSAANVVLATEVRGAEDKGIKVTTLARAQVRDSCVHDNQSGGIQVVDGASVTAVRNVVQRNFKTTSGSGFAEHGLLVGVPERLGQRSFLTTDGNVVRFQGARGISVVNSATATLRHDVVTENRAAGARIETTLAGVQSQASLRGLTLACNHLGNCMAEPGRPCTANADCVLTCTLPVAELGFGAVLSSCSGEGCLLPGVDLGAGGADPGRNAFAYNPNPNGQAPGGINLNLLLPSSVFPLLARGNQWEHCDVTASTCPPEPILALDVRPLAPPAPVDLGTPTGHRNGPAPQIARVSNPRPRKGDVVHVYNGSLQGTGGPFNAIDGTLNMSDPAKPRRCSFGDLANIADPSAGMPDDPCSLDSEGVALANAGPRGNGVRIEMGGLSYVPAVQAVTPTMLVFRMPVDCLAPATLTVARGNAASVPVPFCDPGGCAGRPAGSLCDDGNACTGDDRCNAAGACVPGAPVRCTGTCRTGVCDPTYGCAIAEAGTPCQDGDACTVGDACSGVDTTCLSGSPRNCAGPCSTGACNPGTGCDPLPATVVCNDGSVCTQGDHCSGVDETCVGTTSLDCSGQCFLPGCDAQDGCIPAGSDTPCDDGDACTIDERCTGVDGTCAGGTPITCAGQCRTGACDPASGCTPSPVGTPCDDGDACTAADACTADGSCAASPRDCDDGDACTADSCDSSIGCVHIPLVEGSACAAPDRCQAPGTCRSGVCEPGPSLACDDGDACTEDGCNSDVGCVNTPRRGIESVSCRLTGMQNLLDGVVGEPGPRQKRLRKRLARAARALGRAATATAPGKQRRELKKAKAALKQVTVALHGTRRELPSFVQRALEELAAAARAALGDLRR
ncbi:MAG: right-handed parallel beta-helix repeat-containing protein [bacterium]|nr:right-handed parallel beta-helix repeat-containing protein [bacterium]